MSARLPGGRRPWTATDRAHLARLYAHGAAYVDIAAALGRTLGAIKQALHQYHRHDRRPRPGRGAHSGIGHRRRDRGTSATGAAVLDAFLRKPPAGSTP